MSDFSFSIFPNENFVDLRLFQFGYEQCIPLHSFGPFIRNHYLFHYIISGKGYLESVGTDGLVHHYDLSADQGFLICPGMSNTYCASANDPWKYVWLEFDGLRVMEFLNSAGLSSDQPVYQAESTTLANSVRDSMLYIADNPGLSPLHLIGQLYLFLDQLIQTSTTRREMKGRPLKDFYVQEAVNFIGQNYQKNITVEEIADVCRLNRSYFSKLFKESMGCSPQEFVIRLRLSKATELMSSNNMSIGDIAALCGYPNQLHFSRAFKKHYGISPREWRIKNGISTKKD